MAPCTLERTETVGNITISQYSTWPQFGGGFEVVARNGSDIERIHTRSAAMADETFAMLVGKYSGHNSETPVYAGVFGQEARELCAWASGR